MAIRFNVYLNDELEVLFNQLKDNINQDKLNNIKLIKNKKGVNIPKYQPISNSSLVQELIKKFYTNERAILVEKLDYYNRQSEIYENKLKSMNKKLFNNTDDINIINEVLVD